MDLRGGFERRFSIWYKAADVVKGCRRDVIPENFVKRTFRAILRDGKNLGKLKEQVKISE